MTGPERLLGQPPIGAESLKVAGEKGFWLEVSSLRANPGDMVALVGPNGSGKSTLLEALAGLLAPESGAVRWFGKEVRGLAPTDPVRLDVGVQLQTPAWNPSMKVREVLALHRSVYGRASAGVLDQLGVAELADRAYGRLSTGQRRRVDLVVALAHDPGVVLLDEPATGLDRQFAQAMRQCLASRRAAGAAILLATHHGQEVVMADRVLWLERGTVKVQARPFELLHDRLGEFVGMINCSDGDTAEACQAALSPLAVHIERDADRVTVYGHDKLRHAVPALAERHRADAFSLRRTDGDDLLALVSGQRRRVAADA